MKIKASVKQPVKKSRRVLKSFVGLLGVSIFATSIWYVVWKNSGSGQWKLESDKQGVQIYSLKQPGSSLKKFKGIIQTDYTLSHLVAALIDDTVETCADWIPGCISVDHIDPWDPETLSNTLLWTVDAIPMVDPVELIVKASVKQDDDSKIVQVRFESEPDRLPENDCCKRVRHMFNSWTYRPLANGKTEVEFEQDFSMGEFTSGLMPNVVFSLMGPTILQSFFVSDIPRVMDKEKYRVAAFDFIEEVN